MKSLFDKTTLGTMQLKNRFFRSAAGDSYAVNGHITEKDMEVYERLAKGGVGTIITGNTYVSDNDNPLPTVFGIVDDSYIDEYKKLTDMVHGYSAKIIMQLFYCGSHTASVKSGTKVLAPSAVAHINTKVMPQEMNKEEIKFVQQAFADAAVRAKKAGFDGVQIHAAHGFILSQFLTPYYNRRTDEYGGSNENRTRMLLEAYQLTRAAVGSDYPVLVKINCVDDVEQGITFEGFSYACNELSNSGIEAIEVSGAWYLRKSKDEFYFKEFAEKVAEKNRRTSFILVGGNRNYDAMTTMLNETAIEYFSLCRPLIAEPDLINRWESGDISKTKCISCNGCIQPTHAGRCVLKN